MRNKKILVTGTAGFIGYHLVKRLVQDSENEVIGLIILTTITIGI
jgi:nucleoside-diphosphate-sugar epimerase